MFARSGISTAIWQDQRSEGRRASLGLQFAGATALDSRITFTRGSNATMVGSNGLIQYAPHNLLTYSQEFDNAAWSKIGMTATANAGVSPDGTTTASRIVYDGAGNPAVSTTQNVADNAPGSNQTIVVSAWLKSFGGSNQSLRLKNTHGGVLDNFSPDLTVTNQWQRFTFSVTNGAGVGTSQLFGLSPETGNAAFDVLAWGAQLNVGALQPYYPTTSAAYYGPRLVYDPVTLAAQGLLVEEQRTNLLTYSQAFDNAAWVKGNATVTANAVVGPDGTMTASKLVENTANSDHSLRNPATVVSGTTYTINVYVKAAERTQASIAFYTDTTVYKMVLNLTTGAFVSSTGTGSYEIKNAGNGWWRVSVTAVASSVTLNPFIFTANAGVTTYLGDGTSGIYIWGAQLEAGAFATSYIPTTTAQATRAADVATMTGTNFSSWYNQTEGTVVAEFGPYGNGGASSNPGIIEIDDGTSNNLFRVFAGSSVSPVFNVVVAGVAQTYMSTGTLTTTAVSKIASAYKVNDFSRSVNGAAPETDTSGTLPTVNQMKIASGLGGVGTLNGTIRSITYYPRRLANTELQALTS